MSNVVCSGSSGPYLVPQYPQYHTRAESLPSTPSTSFNSFAKAKRALVHIAELISSLWQQALRGLRGLFGSKDSSKQKVEAVFESNLSKKALAKEPQTVVWTEEALRKVSQDTQKFIDHGFYETPTEKMKVPLLSGKTLSERSKRYECQAIDRVEPRFSFTHVLVREQDCLDVAQELVQKGNKVVVLLFSGPESAGGGYEDGKGNGQEENIIIRSDLRGFMYYQDAEIVSDFERAHKQSLFPIHENCLIHTPGVTVFRENKAQIYALSDTPFQIGILISAARNLKQYERGSSQKSPTVKLENDEIDYGQEEMRQEIELMIKNQLLRAYQASYDTVVLGAFGCGAFGHPPQAVAKLYRHVIDNYFKGAFKEIVFAILDDGRREKMRNPQGNVKPFKDCFQEH